MSSTPTPSRFSPQVPGLEAPAFSDVAQYISQVVSPQSTKTPLRRKSLAPSLNVDAMEDNGVESIPGANVVSRLLSASSQRSKIAEEQKKKRNEFVSLFSNRLTREFRHPMTFPVVQSDGKMHLPPSRHTVTEDDIVELKATLEKSSSSAVAKDAKDVRTLSAAPPEGMFPQTDWWDGRLPPIRGAGGIMNTAMRTLTLANRQTEAHVTLRAARDISGWFFHDVSENTFLAKEVVSCLSDHVDISLRLSGLIKQMGSYKTYTSLLEGTPVVYDEASWTWVSVASRVPIAGGKPDRQSLVDRLDLVPTGIISVVGNLDIGDLTDDVMASKKPSREAMRQKRKANHATAGSNKTKKSPAKNAEMKKMHDERPPLPPQSSGQPCQDGKKTVDFGPTNGDENHNARPAPSSSVDAAAEFTSGYDIRPYDNDDKDEQMIMVIGDPDSEFLSTAEVLKYIKHYLTRAVVKAARTAGASIICDGTGDIARQLSLGYQAFLDPVGIKGHKAAVNTHLVGVSARCHSNIVSLDVSHNVLLQCDSGHTEGGPTCGNCFKEHEGFCQGNADYERLKAMSVLGSVAHPTPDAIRMFKLRMLESLHNGHHQQMIYQDSDRSSQAPNRDAIPIMIIVFGGATDVTRREVHTAAQRGWPILIVEGSGGYADILCSTINKINVLSPDASSDDYRRLLTTVDPETSAIIANGSWQIIQRGLEVSQVERLILTALKGDEILHQAWKWYSSWYFNQLQWAYYHQLQQLTILMLGIFATLASVTQTFLILLFRERSTNSTFLDRWGNDDVLPDEKYWYMMFRILQWLVIGLPITLTLVHAVFQRMNPWAKVSAFRVAASSLLCEIYMYRTRTLGYSTEAVKRNRSGAGNDNPLATAGKGAAAAMKMTHQAEEAAKGGGAKQDAKIAEESSAIGVEQRFVYNSREELLGHRMRKIQMTLGASEAGLVRLEENIDRNIPPSDITKNGDGGLADLSPDAYVKFRVSTLRREYWKRHRSLDRQQSMLTALVIFFGATGTALAALSAYGLGYLQAWVAFSTVVVNSLTRFLDFTRISAMAELCNTAEHQLGSVERWWSSVGTDADSDRNRMKLVSDAEHAIRSELEGWSKQMQSMDDDDEAEAAQGAADARADAQHVDDAAVEESKSLGTDLLKSDTIYKSLQDSGGNLALKVRRQILDLNDKLGGFIKPPPGPEKAGNASDPTSLDDMNAG
ncbi:transmembrane protein, putative, partial [Bodo saltans]